MFQKWIKLLLLKCVGSALKFSETQVWVRKHQQIATYQTGSLTEKLTPTNQLLK